MKTKAPAYQAIYNSILKKINKGEYSKETPIPSENELSKKHGVSRMTARKSVDMLVNEGYLLRQKGRGTFITGRKNLTREVIGFTERMKDAGLRVYNEVKSFSLEKILPKEVQDVLQLNDEYVVVIERMRYVNDRPTIFETVYIPHKFVETATDEMFTGSLTQLLEEYAEIGYLKRKCEAGRLKKKQAKLFGKEKDDLALKVNSTLSFMDGTVCLYSVSYQNTEYLEFSADIVK